MNERLDLEEKFESLKKRCFTTNEKIKLLVNG
jgi:hypothetical protein